MLIKFPAKTRYLFNIVLPFVLLFQGTLSTIENQIYIQTNFEEWNLPWILLEVLLILTLPKRNIKRPRQIC